MAEIARLLFLTLFPAMPDTQHRYGVIVRQVVQDIRTGDPTAHASRLFGFLPHVGLVEQTSDRSAQQLAHATDSLRVVLGDESTQPIEVIQRAPGKVQLHRLRAW